MIVCRLGEFREEVNTTRVCLVLWKPMCFDLLNFGSPLMGSFLGKLGNREDCLGEADALSKQTDWVLLKEEVENRYLANLVECY